LFVVDKFEDGEVVGEGNIAELMRESFLRKEGLLLLEYLGEVDLVQTLVGVVYEELLQTVLLQDLETVDVQETQVQQLFVTGIGGNRVYFVDGPLEQTLVEDLGEGVDQLLHLPDVEVFG
jgi:hypothetical protein